MSGNSTGKIFRLTTFGESHSPAIGGTIDGCPSGLSIDYEFIQAELDRRKPGYQGSTQRREFDSVEFLSGIVHGKTLGTPLGFIIKNADINWSDYENISHLYRPSHADFTYAMKYGTALPGGGRASGRETAARIVGGSVAKLLLRNYGIEINADVAQIGDIAETEKAAELIRIAEAEGDTLGGTVKCLISGVPVGLGEPVFDKLQADLAKAMLSIGSAKAFEYGLGFNASTMKGSEYNDQMTGKDGKVVFLSNNDGGIQGGISNGEEIYFKVGFKPVPSIKISQSTANAKGESAEITIGGRHDTCHVPRLVVIVESMAALVLADHMLRSRVSRLP
jgi:chorismate synthase